jgi:hypothetical protein
LRYAPRGRSGRPWIGVYHHVRPEDPTFARALLAAGCAASDGSYQCYHYLAQMALDTDPPEPASARAALQTGLRVLPESQELLVELCNHHAARGDLPAALAVGRALPPAHFLRHLLAYIERAPNVPPASDPSLSAWSITANILHLVEIRKSVVVAPQLFVTSPQVAFDLLAAGVKTPEVEAAARRTLLSPGATPGPWSQAAGALATLSGRPWMLTFLEEAGRARVPPATLLLARALFESRSYHLEEAKTALARARSVLGGEPPVDYTSEIRCRELWDHGLKTDRTGRLADEDSALRASAAITRYRERMERGEYGAAYQLSLDQLDRYPAHPFWALTALWAGDVTRVKALCRYYPVNHWILREADRLVKSSAGSQAVSPESPSARTAPRSER